MSLISKSFIKEIKKISVDTWPSFIGDQLEIRIPSNLRKKELESTRGGANINIILSLLEKTKNVKGNIAECGVYRGATIITTGIVAQKQNKLVFGFDSFEGFDEDIKVDLDLGGPENEEKKVGGFNKTSYDLVLEKIKIEFVELANFIISLSRIDPAGWMIAEIPDWTNFSMPSTKGKKASEAAKTSLSSFINFFILSTAIWQLSSLLGWPAPIPTVDISLVSTIALDFT